MSRLIFLDIDGGLNRTGRAGGRGMLTRCILARQIKEGMRIVSTGIHFLEAAYDAERTQTDTKLRRVVE